MAETLKEMMSAYVTGCLDNANLVQFLDYIESGGKINKDELGELQNVAAMIPIILEMENPPASLQSKIFQQIPDNEKPVKTITKSKKAHLREVLESKRKEAEVEKKKDDLEIEIPEEVSFKNTTKKKKVVEKPEDKIQQDPLAKESTEKVTVKTSVKYDETNEQISESAESGKSQEDSEPIFVPKDNKIKKKKITVGKTENSLEEYPHVTVKETIRKTMIVPPTDLFPSQTEKIIPTDECEENNGTLQNTLVAKIVTASSILIAIILLVLYYSTKSELTEKVTGLQKEKNVLQSEVNSKDDFISSNLPLIESFNQKDLIVVPLAGTEDKGTYSARILLSPSSRRGVLQFLKTPDISPNESLQLWLISKGLSYSVGIFHPKSGQKFYQLNKLPHLPFDEIEMFRITKEPASGSEFPSGNTLYFGAFPVK